MPFSPGTAGQKFRLTVRHRTDIDSAPSDACAMKTAIREMTCASTHRTIMVARSVVQAQVGSCDPVCRVCGRLRSPEKAESAMGMPVSQDRSFIALLDAYRPHGGISRLHHLSTSERVPSSGADIDVARLVREGHCFAFQWHYDLWVPLFQFEPDGQTLAAAPQRVIAELDRGFDGWDLANWFVQPNAWLDCHSPVEWLNSHLPEVLQAARADRFSATV